MTVNSYSPDRSPNHVPSRDWKVVPGGNTSLPPRDYKPSRNGSGATAGVEAESLMPNSPAMEEALIGSLLLDRETIVKVASILEPADFFSQERGLLYGVIKELFHKGVPADLQLVTNALKERELLGEGEGKIKLAYLLQQMQSSSSPVHAVHYAKKIHDYSCRRKIIELGAQITAMGFPGEGDLSPDKALVETDRLVQDLRAWRSGIFTNERVMTHESTLGIIERLHGLPPGVDLFTVDPDELARIKKEKRNRKQVPLGWPCFDGIVGEREPSASLIRSHLAMVIAGPSVGKSTFGGHVADNAAAGGFHVGVFYNELSEEDYLYRCYAKLTGIRSSRIRREDDIGGVLSDGEWKLLWKAAAEKRSWPGRVDYFNVSGMSGKAIRDFVFQLARDHKQIYGRELDLVIVDYLGRMESDNARRYKDQYDYQGENVKSIAQINTRLKIPVMLLAQATREEAKKGKLDMFSGALTAEIERDSQLIITLEMAGDTKKGQKPDDFVKATLVKNSDGKKGESFLFKHLKGKFDFEEVDDWEGFMGKDAHEKGGGEWDPEAEADFESGAWKNNV